MKEPLGRAVTASGSAPSSMRSNPFDPCMLKQINSAVPTLRHALGHGNAANHETLANHTKGQTAWFLSLSECSGSSVVFQAYPSLVKTNQTMHPLHGNRAIPKHCSFASRIGGGEQQRLGLERRGQNLDPFDRLTGFCGSNRLAPISLQLDGSGKLAE